MVVAQTLAEFDVQRSLEDLFRQPGQQPTRAGQLDALRAGLRHQLLGLVPTDPAPPGAARPARH
jgi:hypothetical protein